MSVRLFRNHHGAQLTSSPDPLYARLLDEWTALNRSMSAERSVAGWAKTEPALAGLDAPWRIVDAIDASTGDATDELIAALVRIFQTGDRLAGRVLLQVFLPKLHRMGQGNAVGPWAIDATQVGLAEFWDVLTDYPIGRRTQRVASNLMLDTLHAVTRRSRTKNAAEEFPAEETDLDWIAAQQDTSSPGTDSEDLSSVVVWAVGAGAVTREDGQLLLNYYSRKAFGISSDQIASDAGLSAACLRQRVARTRKSLISAAKQDLAGVESACSARSAAS